MNLYGSHKKLSTLAKEGVTRRGSARPYIASGSTAVYTRVYTRSIYSSIYSEYILAVYTQVYTRSIYWSSIYSRCIY